MTAQILFGKPVVEKIATELAPDIEEFRKAHGVAPTLAVAVRANVVVSNFMTWPVASSAT